MLKLGFNMSFIDVNPVLVRLSPSLTFSFCWVYKKKGNKMFSGSFCPIGVGCGNIPNEVQSIEKTKEEYEEEYKAKNEYKFSKKVFPTLFEY